MPAPEEEPAPVFGAWRRLYAAVVGWLLLLIALFYLLTVTYRPR